MITIKMHDEKWKIEINEVWKFERTEEFKNILDKLIQNKELFGKLGGEK